MFGGYFEEMLKKYPALKNTWDPYDQYDDDDKIYEGALFMEAWCEAVKAFWEEVEPKLND